MLKKYSITTLVLSILCLVFALLVLYFGSKNSQLYNQMKSAKIVYSLSDLEKAGNSYFLLSGFISKEHKVIKEDLIAYDEINGDQVIKEVKQELEITLKDGYVKLLDDYQISDYNTTYNGGINGIKAGSEITIYAIKAISNINTKIKGYKLYPGSPKQYINYLYSPYSSYRVYIRVLISLALLFFVFSFLINIKK